MEAKATKRGTILLKESLSKTIIELRDVLYIPKFRRNIISTGKLVNQGSQVLIMKEGMIMINKGNITSIKITKEERTNLFVLTAGRIKGSS